MPPPDVKPAINGFKSEGIKLENVKHEYKSKHRIKKEDKKPLNFPTGTTYYYLLHYLGCLT